MLFLYHFAASRNEGIVSAALLRSSIRFRSSRIERRISSALCRASPSETQGYPPRPISGRLPLNCFLSTQFFARVFLSTIRTRLSPSLRVFVGFLACTAVNFPTAASAIWYAVPHLTPHFLAAVCERQRTRANRIDDKCSEFRSL